MHNHILAIRNEVTSHKCAALTVISWHETPHLADYYTRISALVSLLQFMNFRYVFALCFGLCDPGIIGSGVAKSLIGRLLLLPLQIMATVQ